MAGDIIDPLEGPRGIPPVDSHGRRPAPPSGHGPRARGVITAIHRKSGRHEGEHVLDTSVGAQPYDEIVIRITDGVVDDWTGESVIIALTTR